MTERQSKNKKCQHYEKQYKRKRKKEEGKDWRTGSIIHAVAVQPHACALAADQLRYTCAGSSGNARGRNESVTFSHRPHVLCRRLRPMQFLHSLHRRRLERARRAVASASGLQRILQLWGCCCGSSTGSGGGSSRPVAVAGAHSFPRRRRHIRLNTLFRARCSAATSPNPRCRPLFSAQNVVLHLEPPCVRARSQPCHR